jgi:hypothetical protein
MGCVQTRGTRPGGSKIWRGNSRARVDGILQHAEEAGEAPRGPERSELSDRVEHGCFA